jgi:hypothetical protein
MNNELEGIRKKAVMAERKVLSRYLPEEIDKNRRKSQSEYAVS